MVEHVLGAGRSGRWLTLVFFVEGLACDGTKDCLRRVKAAGLPWREFTQAAVAS
ncbi:hypothetical protein [Streptacidiphilus melanogenes]|uniref:hypothetical protein n=1 Tax=Streptacidiphilus melanogenes TaxID=411235 RepID=UPI000AE5C92A|nr:hypothetical protein [Streptacidiphilus melanogenes]